MTVNAQTPLGTQIIDSARAGYAESTAPVVSNGAVLTIRGAMRGNWWMFHHDQWHLGLSPTIGPANATRKWAFNAADSVNSSPAIGADGTIYVGSYDHNLYAINPDGSQQWTFATDTDIDSSPAIGTDGTIYIGSDDGNLYAVNPDGTQKWAFTTDDWVYAAPAIGADGTIYVGSLDGNLYAVNPDGTPRWTFATNNWVVSSPTIGTDGTIYVGSDDYNFYAINPDGTLKWAFPTLYVVRSSAAIGLDGTIYVGSFDGYLYAINPNGTKKWAFATRNAVFGTPALGADGTIYLAADDDNVYAVTPNGTQLWAFGTGNYVASSPAIGADGTIYVGSADNNIYALNADGTERWCYTTGNSVTSSPAIGADGTLYIGSSDGNLYAFSYQQNPALTLTQSVSSSLVPAGSTLTYTLRYQNIGPVTASAVQLSAVLPPGLTYVRGSASGSGILNGNTVRWSPFTLAPGASGQLAFKATVSRAATTGTELATSAQLDCYEVPAMVMSNTCSVTVTGLCQLTPSAGPNGSLSPSTVQMVNYGSTVNFTASPQPGFTVANWTVNGSVLQVGGTQFTLPDITGDACVKVTFKPNT